MGRLTLNVLLSFAQFEREVIGERVRDKIGASKRKGIWVGGPVPLGYASVNKKVVAVPEEAQTVRLIFRRYLELGSLRTLIKDLDRSGIRTRRQQISNGRARGGIRFGVGALAYLLRNRFYIGEIVYRGAVHRAEHKPIVDRAVFEAVQAGLSAAAVDRQLRIKGSPGILAGRIFDDRGNRMSPTHTNKRGARYRYYVSHAILQKRNDEAGRISRVPAHEIESVVIKAIRAGLGKGSNGTSQHLLNDRDQIEQRVERIIIRPQEIEIHLVRETGQQENQEPDDNSAEHAEGGASAIMTVPWNGAIATEVKGILHSPSARQTMSPENRDVLLLAVAKARTWVDDLVQGHAASFAEIAQREGKGEDHVRFLTRLAFVSPRVISGIVDNSVPNEFKVTALAKGAVHLWAEQKRRFEIP